MKYIQSLIRLAIAVFVCGFISFANITTADAAQSSLKKGMEQLPGIQTKAEDVTKASPYSNQNRVDYKSNRGLNEVQGEADINRMNKNAGGDTLPAVTQVEKAVEKVGSNISSTAKDTQDSLNSVVDKAGDAANYVKNKSGDVLNSVADKVSDTTESVTESVKNGTKSMVSEGVNNLKDNSKTYDSFLKDSVQDTPESIKFNNVRAFKERDGDFKDRTNDLQTGK